MDKVTNLFIKVLDFFQYYMNAWNLLPYGNKFGHKRTSVSSTAENKEFSLQSCRITASHSLIVPIISWLSKYLTCPKSTLLWFSALKFVLVGKKKWDCFMPAIIMVNNTLLECTPSLPIRHPKVIFQILFMPLSHHCVIRKTGLHKEMGKLTLSNSVSYFISQFLKQTTYTKFLQLPLLELIKVRSHSQAENWWEVRPFSVPQFWL